MAAGIGPYGLKTYSIDAQNKGSIALGRALEAFADIQENPGANRQQVEQITATALLALEAHLEEVVQSGTELADRLHQVDQN